LGHLAALGLALIGLVVLALLVWEGLGDFLVAILSALTP
jgi:hypothetical protein